MHKLLCCLGCELLQRYFKGSLDVKTPFLIFAFVIGVRIPELKNHGAVVLVAIMVIR